MKVVLFCGGQGMRMREYSDQIPKPMVPIGNRPILWHIMKYYAHFGHTDFILCLGYRADVIKRFFIDYDEAESNDFVLRKGGKEKELLGSDIDHWNITFVNTGMHAQVGQRLLRVREHLKEEKVFLANYADGVTDLDLDSHVKQFLDREEATAGFLAVRPPSSYHVVSVGADDVATGIGPIADADLWLNGGYFVFRSDIFDFIHGNEDIPNEPFQRLIRSRQLFAHRFEGFWTPMDTFKEKQYLDDLYSKGDPPWVLWEDRGQ